VILNIKAIFLSFSALLHQLFVIIKFDTENISFVEYLAV